ncbi:MAG: prepilin-type N-terminal cleavage/methylation domain-containing protein [Bacilli bacterium]|nr:prepilin-type N-terminal cleavage/methylation domain-containing protein [Bacilli bacterium]
MKKGFTLIELLAVIVILGLLALVVTPGIAKVIKNSKINTAEASLEGYVREVENAGALYMTETGLVPTTLDDLVLDGKNLNQIENANVTFNAGGQVSRATATIDGLSCEYVEGEGAECTE